MSAAIFDISDGRNRYEACPQCARDFDMGLVTKRGRVAVQCMGCDFRGPEIDQDLRFPTCADQLAFDGWNAYAEAARAQICDLPIRTLTIIALGAVCRHADARLLAAAREATGGGASSLADLRRAVAGCDLATKAMAEAMRE